MKRILAVSLVVLALVEVASAALKVVDKPNNKIGIEIKKGVNAGYEVSLPVEIGLQSRLPFLPKATLETAMVFTAPRGEFISSMGSLNHSHFDARIGGQIKLFGGDLKLSTGLVGWFAGNNEGVPEGVMMDNAASFTFGW